MGAIRRAKLAAVLGMLGSDHDGEALAAARTAERLRREAGVTWHDLLTMPAAPATEAHTARDEIGWRAALAICRAHRGELTPWEMHFVDTLASYRRPTPRQLSVLARIFAKVA